MRNRLLRSIHTRSDRTIPPSRRSRFWAVGFSAVFCIAVMLSLTVGGCVRPAEPEPSGVSSASGTSAPPSDTSAPESTPPADGTTDAPDSLPFSTDPVTDAPETDPPATEPPVTDPPATEPPVTEPPVTDPPVTDPPETQPVSNGVVRVPASDPVDDSFFADAVFIGDSRTVGLYLFSGLASNYYCEQSLNVSTVQTKAYISAGNDDKVTLRQALSANSFHAVYISFGINEIGWPSAQGFFDTYESLIRLVWDCVPDADVYVQSVLPMTKAASQGYYSQYGGNARVAEYNRGLLALCEKLGVYFIDLDEIFADAEGNLNVSDTTDGIHLGVASSVAWVDYLRTHTVS